jgi:hypothetical protein
MIASHIVFEQLQVRPAIPVSTGRQRLCPTVRGWAVRF